MQHLQLENPQEPELPYENETVLKEASPFISSKAELGSKPKRGFLKVLKKAPGKIWNKLTSSKDKKSKSSEIGSAIPPESDLSTCKLSIISLLTKLMLTSAF